MRLERRQRSDGSAPHEPHLARAILSAILRSTDRPFVLADLSEEFEERARRQGELGARRWYRGQVRRSLVPSLRHRFVPPRPHRSKRGLGKGTIMLGLLSDIRVALRHHRRTPITTGVTILSLGLGIGAVTVAATLFLQHVLPAPVGLREPERLATLYTSGEDGDPYGLSSYPDFLDMREGLDALEDLAALSLRSLALAPESSRDRAARQTESLVESESKRSSDMPTAVPLLAEEVTGNYFGVTGIQPILGRGILPEDAPVEATTPGSSAKVVVLGHRLWQRRFHGNPGVLGETVALNGHRFVVVGIAPKGLVSRRVPLEIDAWIPLGVADGSARADGERFSRRDHRSFLLIGRLRPGATLSELEAQAPVLGARLGQAYEDDWQEPGGRRRTLTAVAERASRLNPRSRGLLAAIGGFFIVAAGLILLLGCSNAASLFLARAAGRRREMAVRRSLGASRGRLVRLWLIDGLVPGLGGAGVGLALVFLIRHQLASFTPPLNVPLKLNLDIGPSVLLTMVLLAVATSVLFALAPAITGSRTDLVAAIKEGKISRHPSTWRQRLRVRNLPVVAQCAAAIILLVGATLFVRSLNNAAQVDLGLHPERVAVATEAVDRELLPETGLLRYGEIVEQLEGRTDVESVALARSVELTFLQMTGQVSVVADVADPPPFDQQPSFYRNSVTPGYLEMLEVPLLRGRTFVPTDRAGSPLVAVVNETFAARFWPGQEALGRHFLMSERGPLGESSDESARRFQVVGVVRDGKYLDFDDRPTPYLWTALAQDYTNEVAVLVKGRRDAASMMPLLREVVTAEPGEVQRLSPSLLEDQLSLQFIHLRIASRVLAWAGTFGLFLAALGIYGIVALSVAQRRRELAIRIAVGAQRGQVLRSVLGDSLRLVTIGLVGGLVVVVPLAGLLRSVLVRVSPLDPFSLAVGSGLLLATALVATLGPARQATRSDPLSALRQE